MLNCLKSGLQYRQISGELKTNRELGAAREDMEVAVIMAGNAYIKLQEEHEIKTAPCQPGVLGKGTPPKAKPEVPAKTSKPKK
jgi:hypothetical protein